MKIEILYPELCCLYGDKGNMQYLRLCLPDAEFFTTELTEEPRFLREDIDLCYLCSMSENSQERILARWTQWKDEIGKRFREGKTLFLLVGNAMELFGQYIQREDGSKIPGLGYFPTYALRQAPNRFNSLIQAKFQDMTLLGYTGRFSHTYGITEDMALCQVEIGAGANPDTKLEGILQGRVVATYLLGPLLVQNPDFTRWLLGRLGVEPEPLPFEAALREAYNYKLKEYAQPDLGLA